MRYIEFDDDYDTAILIKSNALRAKEINKYYIEPTGIKAIGFDLDYGGKKKPSAGTRKEYLAELLPVLVEQGVTDVLCCDGEYFKTLTGERKAETNYGYAKPCKIKGFEHLNIFISGNYQAVTINPAMQSKIDLSLKALTDHKRGEYVDIGSDIIHSAEYPNDYLSIIHMLDSLQREPAITSDIEAFSLKHYNAGIGTIGFAVDKHNGFSFCVDYVETEPYEVQVWCNKDHKFKTRIAHGKQVKNLKVRELLKNFFETYKGRIIWHNASFDAYVLIYQLWMDDLLDQEGLLEGLEIMHGSVECSKLVTYLATNSTAGNKLGLKEQAHEFAGNFAEDDVVDIRLMEKGKLLKYNLIDCLSTWYVMDKNYPIMLEDDQGHVYVRFKKYLKDILQMQLTGLCLDMPRVLEVEKEMTVIRTAHLSGLRHSPLIKQFTVDLRYAKMKADNEKLKNKKRTYEEVSHNVFNPNSNPQLESLLYSYMDLPVIDLTDNKNPATGGKTLKKLRNHVANTEDITQQEINEREKIIDDLRAFAAVDKVLSAFIPAFKAAPKASDGYHYLFGNFNLGGTVSGRLSANNPNLQQIPSGSTYAKLIKSCFVAPPGWVFVGADYASLEDRIDALLTKDPNKLAVYTDGYDGHCLRAYYYFPEDYVGIPKTPEAINATKDTHEKQRQDSKGPTFALTYGGMWKTLVNNLGWSVKKAMGVVANYEEMYQVSMNWKTERLKQCCKDGYAIVAFGLKVRTPLLAKTFLGTKVTPFQAESEGRTVGNAMGQSYGLLNSHSGNKVLGQVRSDPEMRLRVRPCAHIHDAQYYLVRDDFPTIHKLNQLVGTAMSWQGLPEIQHPEVKLSGELDIFYPTWKDGFTLKNDFTEADIVAACEKEILKRKED